MEEKEVVVFEHRTDEPMRTFKDDCVGTLRTTDACGDKYVLIKEATKKGYTEMEVGGVCDLSYPNNETRRGHVQGEGNVSPTLTANNTGIVRIERQVKESLTKEDAPKCINLYKEDGKEESFQKRVYDTDFISPAITTSFRPSYLEKKAELLKVGSVSNEGSQAGDVYSEEGISQTLCACTHGYAMGNVLTKYRIRKLTPLECFRLMGVTDDNARKMLSVNSNSQCYKQAGNSIVVDVMAAMFRRLF